MLRRLRALVFDQKYLDAILNTIIGEVTTLAPGDKQRQIIRVRFSNVLRNEFCISSPEATALLPVVPGPSAEASELFPRHWYTCGSFRSAGGSSGSK